MGYDPSYLGTQAAHLRSVITASEKGSEQHILTCRDQSVDTQDNEGYDLQSMQRSDSHTPLHSPSPEQHNREYQLILLLQLER